MSSIRSVTRKPPTTLIVPNAIAITRMKSLKTPLTAPLNLPGTMPEHASQLYSRNVMSLLELITGEEGELSLNFDDEVVAGACITREGEIVHEGAKKAAGATAQEAT